MIEDVLNSRLSTLIWLFLFASFIIRFLDYSLLYVPVMIVGNPEKAGLLIFTVFNYLPRMLYAGIKVTLIASVLYGAIHFVGVKPENGQPVFVSLFKTVLAAEGIFLLHFLARLGYFVIFEPDYTLSDYSEFNPLSIGSLSQVESPLFADFMKNLNIFKLFQVLILIFGVTKTISSSIRKSVGIVVASYGGAYFVWEMFWAYLYL